MKGRGIKYKSIKDFREDFFNHLGDRIFCIMSIEELVCESLIQFSPRNINLQPNRKSLNAACEEVNRELLTLEMMGEDYYYLSGFFGFVRGKDSKDAFDRYCESVIQIIKAPGLIMKELRGKVEADLLGISTLIECYESEPCLKDFFKKGEIPRESSSVQVFDFYQRCLTERLDIINYLLKGLKERVIEKCRERHEAMAEEYKDRPYQFRHDEVNRLFDYKKIDEISHRLSSLQSQVQVDSKWDVLYKDDRNEFYKQLFEQSPLEELLKQMEEYYTSLPTEMLSYKSDRKSVFDELLYLYENKKWISFYALALPQIEGIFSEMCEVLEKKKSNLTQKVKEIRVNFLLNQSAFDYFQYILPQRRNQFAHLGIGSIDFKLGSYDCVTDLFYVITVFASLDSPLVRVKRRIVSKDVYSLNSLEQLVNYFEDLDEVHQNRKKIKHYKSLAHEIAQFERDFICKGNQSGMVIVLIVESVKQSTQQMEAMLNILLRKEGLELRFREDNLSRVKKQIIEKKLHQSIRVCFEKYEYEYNKIDFGHRFLKSFEKHLPSLNKGTTEKLQVLNKEHGEVISKIVDVYSLVTKK